MIKMMNTKKVISRSNELS